MRRAALFGMPFGPGPAAALAEGLKLAEELGFATRNYDNYVGTADLNDKETALPFSATWTWWARAPAGQ